MPNPTFFDNFPKQEVTVSGVTRNLTDISRSVRMNPSVLASKYAFYDYVIKEGERPDHVAFFQYGDSGLYWIVLLINNIRDVWREWPMDTNQFNSFIVKKYGTIDTAKSAVHQYVDNQTGVVIDNTTRLTMDPDDYTTITKYQHEDRLNESKRRIKLIQQRYLSDIQTELETLFEDS